MCVYPSPGFFVMCHPTLRTSTHLSRDSLSLGVSSSVLQLHVSGCDLELPLVKLFNQNSATKKKKKKKIEMRKLHITVKRLHVKRTILKLFLRSLVRSTKRVFFIHSFSSFMDVFLGTIHPAQLTFLVAFVEPLGPIIAHACV